MRTPASTHKVQTKAQAWGAITTLLVLMIALVFSATRQPATDEGAVKEISQVQTLLAAAPKQGDYEILVPAHLVQSDLIIRRIQGFVEVILPQMSAQDCRNTLNAAHELGGFERVIIHAQGADPVTVDMTKWLGSGTQKACGEDIGRAQITFITSTEKSKT